MEWKGFDGGAEVKQRLTDLLSGLRERARRLESIPALETSQEA
jgi:hypothetical protein